MHNVACLMSPREWGEFINEKGLRLYRHDVALSDTTRYRRTYSVMQLRSGLINDYIVGERAAYDVINMAERRLRVSKALLSSS